MYCRNCGTQLKPEQKFCHNCGTKKEEIEKTQALENNNQVTHQTNMHVQQVNNNINHQTQTHMQQVNNNMNQQTQVHAQQVNNHMNHQTQTHQINNHQSFQQNNLKNENRGFSEQTLNELEKGKKRKKGNPVVIVLIVLGVLIVVAIFLAMTILSNVSKNSNKLICQSKEGNITIMYDEQDIIGYTAKGMKYDLDGQKEYAKQVGINAYLEEFTDWFEKNTTGTCMKEELGPSTTNHDKDKESKEETNEDKEDTQKVDTKVIGAEQFGYISVPNNWIRFHDLNGSTAYQFSDVKGEYIVTIDYIKEKEYTAKDYASNYLYNMKQSTEVTGVKGATVSIGRNKEYTAYQVYMLYQNEGIYLVTYWFETEDGTIRYLAIEGPTEKDGKKITDYLYIPESFSLIK